MKIIFLISWNFAKGICHYVEYISESDTTYEIICFTFWQPMHFSAKCSQIAGAILSVSDKSEHCENGERYAYGYCGEPTGSNHWVTQGIHLQPLRPALPPN